MGKAAGSMQVTGVKIRRAHFGDVDGIHAIELETFPTPWSRSAFVAELTDNDLAYYLVAEVAGKTIGFAGMWLIVDEAHITNVALSSAFRGQGIGELLMQSLISQARERGARCMTLEVRPTNTVAQQLYTKLGFATTGLRRQYYSDNKEDALIMWLDPL